MIAEGFPKLAINTNMLPRRINFPTTHKSNWYNTYNYLVKKSELVVLINRYPWSREEFYYFVPLSLLVSKIVPINSIHKWKVSHRMFPTIAERQVEIIDKAWCVNETMFDGLLKSDGKRTT